MLTISISTVGRAAGRPQKASLPPAGFYSSALSTTPALQWLALSPPHTPTTAGNGITADDHLLNGLELITNELARANEEISYGTRNEIAVQVRYLDLKLSATATTTAR
jgi:hypothetical protein